MVDQRTMAELLRAPTKGYAKAMVVPLILVEQFELKHRAALRWLEKEPSRSILTWEDLVSKFINEFFPPQEQQISVMKFQTFNNGLINGFMRHGIDTKISFLVLTELYEGASAEMRQHKSFDNVTATHQEGIMVSQLPQEKSLKPDSTGQISSAAQVAYWATKNYNMDLTKARANWFLQINELDEMRPDAYKSSISYTERRKRWHDKRIKTPINYEKGDKTLLLNLRLRLFSKKLKSRWYGPFLISKDLKNGAIELYDKDGNEFIINKQRMKAYKKDVLEANKHDDITLDDEGEVTIFNPTVCLRMVCGGESVDYSIPFHFLLHLVVEEMSTPVTNKGHWYSNHANSFLSKFTTFGASLLGKA
uniref:Reverse transcriptase domain-containing protein n=1 Tax=Tanacetum cinerariifolium TaxID=118510 RepID=A0A6L2J219_TANCI|nr:hypothetical protein [Tanacetum cinerariifolium]